MVVFMFLADVKLAIIGCIDNNYTIGLNYSIIDNSSEEKTILAEELGHYYTNTLYSYSYSDEEINKREFRALKWAFKTLVPFKKLLQLYNNGYRYIYEFAEELGVTEDLIESTNKIINAPSKNYITHNIIDYKRIIELSKKDIKFDANTICNVDINKLNEILNSDNKKFINIGRFSKEKGHERLINAFERLWKKDNSIYLIIIGGQGPEYNNILNKASQSICKNNIIIVKQVSNPYTILEKCDYFILSSFYEGFGIVIAEADILKKPVVSTNIPGPEKFMKKYGGTLIENSEDGLYHGLELLYENKIKPMNVDFEEYNKEAIKEFEKLLK